MTLAAIRILLVEDNPARIELIKSWLPHGVKTVVASSAGKALGILQRDRGRVYSGILLDHDLQEQTVAATDAGLSGSDIVRSMAANVSRTVPVLVHSMNMGRAQGMVEALDKWGFVVTRIPMDRLTKDEFLDWVEEVRAVWEDNLQE
jgi:CheY-like chemotaxis protein